MALPGAVTRRAEREAAALREQGIDPASGAPIVVQAAEGAPAVPVPTPVPSVSPPAVSDDLVALKARIAELEQAESTASGRASTSTHELDETKRQLEAISSNRAFLEGKLSELTTELDKLKSENASIKQTQSTSQIDKAVADLSSEVPTEDQLKAFEPDAIELIKRITNQRMAAVLAPFVERLKAIEGSLGRLKELDKLPQLEETAKVTQLETARQKELEFLRKEVLAHYPDFDTVKNSKEWRDYLGEDIPGRGIKRGHLLAQYRQMFDATGIRAVIAVFYERGKKPGLDSLVVPAKTNADVPTKSPDPKIKASEYKQRLKDFVSKKLPKPEWEKFRNSWDVAVASNNVEMDVEIR